MSRALDMRRRRRRDSGFNLAELTVTSLMMAMLVSGVLMMVGTVQRSSTRHSTESELADDSRLTMDEMLYHLRSGRDVLPSATVGGRTVTTGRTASGGLSLVFRAQGFDDSDPQNPRLLTGVYDTVAFRWEQDDPANPQAGGRLYESIAPGPGSRRPARTDKVLAKGVRSLALTLRASDRFEAAGGTSAASTFPNTFTLGAAPAAAPACFVNGTAAPCTWQPGGTSVTVNGLRRRDEVQVLYPVSQGSGATVDAAALPRVSEVDVALTMAQKDARNVDRVQILHGGARLRNQRL
jgi:hypothetical protein